MLRTGDIVRRYADGPLMKIGEITGDEAFCVWFDARGVIHSRDFFLSGLSPLNLAAATRSCWPETTDIPEELAAQLDADAARKRREKSRKPKQSNKIRRRSGCSSNQRAS